ncbi:MAG: aminodeoxychorismate/anthranilate synthase component II [Flavobacteriales bacterium]|nr:aminodeoxychorismate/anthranilate synthase component II [Flavobacteriales bacterium]
MAAARMRILLLDNYDSFTWNLHHLLVPLVAEVAVVRNDQLSVADTRGYDAIVLSPGPGMPEEAGIMMQLIRERMHEVPMLGVCLGMQGMVQAAGGSLFNLEQVRHGREEWCAKVLPEDPLFRDLPDPFAIGLYHSWAVEPDTLPQQFHVTARMADGTIMAVRHAEHPVVGVQFHPESVMCPQGPVIMGNWVREVEGRIASD